MKLLPPRSTRTDTLFPYTTLFRSPGPDEGRDVAARLAYDPKITTVAIIDGGERHLFNQPLLSGLPTCKPGAHFGDLAPLGCHHCGREAAHGGISAILQFDFSHRDSAFRSEEQQSELKSIMRNSYAVFCLKKTKTTYIPTN